MQKTFVLIALGIVTLFTACNRTTTTTSNSTSRNVNSIAYRLAEEPAGAEGVKQVKEAANDGAEIVVEGRIGGDTNPFVKGQAAFLVVDTSLKPCNEKEDDACESRKKVTEAFTTG